jgi:hypothetical protein
MRAVIILLYFALCALSTAQQKTSAQIIEGKRKIKIIQEAPELAESTIAYISSCRISTPLSGGAGASPSTAILNFRDRVATQPITIIRLDSALRVHDKSGIKGEAPLKLIEITIVHEEEQNIRVFAHTETAGHLIEFRDPSEESKIRLIAKIQKTQEA